MARIEGIKIKVSLDELSAALHQMEVAGSELIDETRELVSSTKELDGLGVNLGAMNETVAECKNLADKAEEQLKSVLTTFKKLIEDYESLSQANFDLG